MGYCAYAWDGDGIGMQWCPSGGWMMTMHQRTKEPKGNGPQKELNIPMGVLCKGGGKYIGRGPTPLECRVLPLLLALNG